jgi:pectin methylesterase-like acyl-CoA thioesterase
MSMKFSTLSILLACLSGAFGQPNSSFYVATTGNDSNPGTQAAPWRTIQHAVHTARAGSTVNVRGGIYEELVSINTSGDATDGFITFRSYPGETAVLEAMHITPAKRSGVLTINDKSYVRIEGFEIRNYRTACSSESLVVNGNVTNFRASVP